MANDGAIKRWRRALELVDKEKPKERTEGYSAARDVVARKGDVAALAVAAADDKQLSWSRSLTVFFTAFVTERNAYTKAAAGSTASSTALKRLEEAAMTIRFVVDRVHHLLERKQVRSIITHMVDRLVQGGKVQPYALSYLRCLKGLLLHPPHRDHVEARQWIEIVTVSFSALVDDKPMSDGKDGLDKYKAVDLSEAVVGRPRSITQEDVEFMGCIEACFRSPASPFSKYGKELLSRLLAFFRTFPAETTAHLPALQALNHLLADLHCNNRDMLSTVAARLWNHILDLWNTKSSAVREQLIIALRQLFHSVTMPCCSATAEVRRAYEIILGESENRWRAEELAMEHLRLGDFGEQHRRHPLPFSSRSIKHGQGFTSAQAASWAQLELAGDMLAWLEEQPVQEKVKEEEGELHLGSSSTKERGKKRIKLPPPVEALLDSLPPVLGTAPSIAAFTQSLQVLLFYCERHVDRITPENLERISSRLAELCVTNEGTWPKWAMLVLASIAYGQESCPPRVQARWTAIWSSSARRLSNPSLGRAACHLANAVTSFGVFDPATLESVIRDVDVSGPSSPSDSVCDFLSSCIGIAASDIRFQTLGTEKHIFGWLSRSWKPFAAPPRSSSVFAAREKVDPLSVSLLIRLCCQCATLGDGPPLVEEANSLPDSALAAFIEAEIEMAVPFTFLRSAKIISSGSSTSRKTAKEKEKLSSTRPMNHDLNRRVLAWVQNDLVEEVTRRLLERPGSESDKWRRVLDALVTSIGILTQADRHKCQVSLDSLKEITAAVLHDLRPYLTGKQWSSVEKAVVLEALSPLLPPAPTRSAQGITDCLVGPGSRSGVSTSAEHEEMESHLREVDQSTVDRWFADPLKQLMLPLLGLLMGPSESGDKSYLDFHGGGEDKDKVVKMEVDSGADADMDFGGGGIKVAAEAGAQENTFEHAPADVSIATVCARAFAFVGWRRKSTARSAGHALMPEYCQATADTKEGAAFILLTEPLFDMVANGTVDITDQEAAQLCDTLGGFLTGYRYSLSERFALLGLRFLESAKSRWLLPSEDGDDSFAENARELRQHYTGHLEKGRIESWRVRLRYLALCKAYAELDPAEQHWSGLNGKYDKDDVLLSSSVPRQLLDRDFRVRFQAASIVPTLMGFLPASGFKRLFKGCGQAFFDWGKNEDATSLETSLTMLVCWANLVIADAESRRRPYLLLLSSSANDPDIVPFVVALLDGVADVLHLPSKSTLFIHYARDMYLEEQREEATGAILRYPELVGGFKDRRELLEACTPGVGPLLLAGEENAKQLARLCTETKRKPSEMGSVAFHSAAALLVLRSFASATEGSEPKQLKEKVEQVAKLAGVKVVVPERLLVGVLGMLYQEKWALKDGLPEFFEDDADGRASAALLLELLPRLDQESWAEPSLPHFSASCVLRACSWVCRTFQALSSPASLYTVLGLLVEDLRQSVFQGLAGRSMLLVFVALSLGVKHHADAIILRTVVRAITASSVGRVAVRPALSRRALVFAFSTWIGAPQAMAGRGAQPLALALLDAARTQDELGEPETLKELEKVYATFSKGAPATAVKSRHFLPTKEGHGAVKVANVEAALSDPAYADRRFAMLKPLARQAGSSDSRLGKTLWKLLARQDRDKHAGSEDSAALAELVFCAGGHIRRPQLEDGSEVATPNEELRSDDDLKRKLATTLLGFTGSSNLELVLLATKALRGIFPLFASNKILDLASLSTFQKREIQYLEKAGEAPIVVRRQRRLDELFGEGTRQTWLRLATEDPAAWVSQFCGFLAEVRGCTEPFYLHIAPLLRTSKTFAEQALTPLCLSLLLEYALGQGDELPRVHLSSYFNSVLEQPTSSAGCVQAIVETATGMRSFYVAGERGSRDNWLDISWVTVSSKAVETDAAMTALMTLELAHEYGQLSQVSEAGRNEILYRIYESIDDPDGFYGIQSHDTRSATLRKYLHEDRHNRAFELHASMADAPSTNAASLSSQAGIVDCLSAFGFNQLAAAVAAALGTAQSPSDLDKVYELGWRMGQWDLPLPASTHASSNAGLFRVLRAIHQGSGTTETLVEIDRQLGAEVSKLSKITTDAPTADAEAIGALLALRECKRWAEMAPEGKLQKAFDKTSPDMSLDHRDIVWSTRTSLLRSLHRPSGLSTVPEAVKLKAMEAEREIWLELSRSYREVGKIERAISAVTRAQVLAKATAPAMHVVDSEFSRILWAQGEHSSAIELLQRITDSVPDEVARDENASRSTLLSTLGAWSSEARVVEPQVCIEAFFEPAVQALQNDKGASKFTPDHQAKILQAFATFADKVYTNLLATIEEKSERFESYKRRKKLEFVEIERRQAQRDSQASSSSLDRVKTLGEKTITEDQASIDTLKTAAGNHLRRALTEYANALIISEKFDDSVYRLCSLWMANFNNPDITKHIKNQLGKIPSYKYIPLVRQLTARLTKLPSTNDPTHHFAKELNMILLRLAKDHPFHTLYHVYALKDMPMTAFAKSRQSIAGSSTERGKAADDILQERMDHKPDLAKAIAIVFQAYHQWSAHVIPKDARTGRITIPESQFIMSKARDLDVPVVTYDLPIDKTCTYAPASMPCVKAYKPEVQMPGGINAPKIVVCIDSFGKPHKQIFKSNDDTRQDAVMEQVFMSINRLLARDTEARRRRLNVRTYNVIPLSSKTGVLQFVDNTETLGDVVTQLYKKYDPGAVNHRSRWKRDLSDMEKRSMHASCKVDLLKATLLKLKPVLRHFAFDAYQLPSLWFDTRMNYTRSVAALSLVGWVVGLGDRHQSNILVDKHNGELVNIDLGIAFGTGRHLPIPETVPFRLTQNIIDGFGMSGVEGVFRRCLSEILRVVRAESGVLMTVLEVLKYDPMQSWALSASLAKRVQGDDRVAGDGSTGSSKHEGEDECDRVLRDIRNKLDNGLSVEYTINDLLAQATDINNLACLYNGWQACV